MKLIVLTNINSEIGVNGELIYRFKQDLSRFKEMTSSGENPHIVMGRKTFDSIGKPLPNRTNIVISKRNLNIEGVKVMSMGQFIDVYKDHPNMWIIGGSTIYSQLIDYADEVYISYVRNNYEPYPLPIEGAVIISSTIKKVKSDFDEVRSSDWIEMTDMEHSICYVDYKRK